MFRRRMGASFRKSQTIFQNFVKKNIARDFAKKRVIKN